MGQSLGRVYKGPWDRVKAECDRSIGLQCECVRTRRVKAAFLFYSREVRARCEVLWPWDLWPLLCLDRIPGQGCVTCPGLYSTGILVQPWLWKKSSSRTGALVMDWSFFSVVLKTRTDRVLMWRASLGFWETFGIFGSGVCINDFIHIRQCLWRSLTWDSTHYSSFIRRFLAQYCATQQNQYF